MKNCSIIYTDLGEVAIVFVVCVCLYTLLSMDFQQEVIAIARYS